MEGGVALFTSEALLNTLSAIDFDAFAEMHGTDNVHIICVYFSSNSY